jgi:hypothetical protein
MLKQYELLVPLKIVKKPIAPIICEVFITTPVLAVKLTCKNQLLKGAVKTVE